MSIEGVVGILLGIGSLLFAFLAWRSSQRGVRVSEEQLSLARKHAELRPDLRASFQILRRRGLPDHLRVVVVNDGNVTAHNTQCLAAIRTDSFRRWEPPKRENEQPDFSFSASLLERLEPIDDEMFDSSGYILPSEEAFEEDWYPVEVYEEDKLLPESRIDINVPIGIFHTDKAIIRYRIVCDEGRMTEGADVEVEVPTERSAN